jgi:hypothetical protein
MFIWTPICGCGVVVVDEVAEGIAFVSGVAGVLRREASWRVTLGEILLARSLRLNFGTWSRLCPKKIGDDEGST